MINKIKCFTKNHKEFDTYTVGTCKIARCIRCGDIGTIHYKVDKGALNYKVDWLSEKELGKFLKEYGKTIRGKAIKAVLNKFATKDM